MVLNSSNETTNTGLTLKVNNLKPDTLEIIVNTDEKFRSENNNLFYLFIQTHGKIDYVSSERMTGGDTKITIPKTVTDCRYQSDNCI